MSRQLDILVNGERRTVTVLAEERNRVRLEIDGRTFDVAFELPLPSEKSPSAPGVKRATHVARGSGAPGEIRAPIPGLVSEVCVSPGDQVQSGAVLLKLEAMKMQNSIVATAGGRVEAVHVVVGEEVTDHQLLVTIQVAS